jgi:hypothetical protein
MERVSPGASLLGVCYGQRVKTVEGEENGEHANWMWVEFMMYIRGTEYH